MATPAEVEQWKRDEAASFEGWNFSHLGGRAFQDEPPWSYRDRAAELIQDARHLLDVDTGGGEFLSALAPLPPGAKAIEGYRPNVALASAHLAASRVEVSEVAVGAPWPFDDASFDLVLNRHGHLNIPETSRTLKPGGLFLTQQVSSANLADLVAVFDRTEDRGDNTLDLVDSALRASGFDIVRAETWSGHQFFADVGALAYFLRAIPWVVPGFSVASHLVTLQQLDDKLRREGTLAFSIFRFLVEARKQA